MRKSEYVSETVYPCEEDGKMITEAQARLEEWLTGKGYVPAVDGAPWDSGEGGYLGTIDAEDLLGEYLTDHPYQDKYCDELREHCWEIGEVFNSDRWHFRQMPFSGR